MRSDRLSKKNDDKLKQDVEWRFLLWIFIFILHGSIASFIYFSKSNPVPMLLMMLHVLPFVFLLSLSKRAKISVLIMKNRHINPLTYNLWNAYYEERWLLNKG